MDVLKRITKYFSVGEWLLWGISFLLIALSFCLFDRSDHLTLLASLIGATSLIFNAKGNPIGQVLMIVFSLIYGYISFRYQYYGEMLTYVCMSMPMAIFALITWLKNPYQGNLSEVKVNRLKKKEPILVGVLALLVTVAFYFILRAFSTKNLFPSTISVTTSFLAVYLIFRRSSFMQSAMRRMTLFLLCYGLLLPPTTLLIFRL